MQKDTDYSFLKQLQTDLKYQTETLSLRLEQIETRLEQIENALHPLNEMIETLKSEKQETPESEYLDTKQAVAFLGLSTSTFNKYLYEGKIKVYKLGPKLNKFKRSDLIEFRHNRLRSIN